MNFDSIRRAATNAVANVIKSTPKPFTPPATAPAQPHKPPQTASQPQNPAQPHDATSSLPGAKPPAGQPAKDPTASGFTEAGKGIKAGLNPRDGINALNSDGDSTTFRLTPEGKAQANVRLGKLGAKGQLGSETTVTQKGEGPDAKYVVRYDKQALAAVTGEIGSDSLGKGKGKGGAVPGGAAPGGDKSAVDLNLKAEVGGQTFDAVEMTFDSKDDAVRAAETMKKITMADAVNNSIDMSLSAAGPVAKPLDKIEDYVNGGNDNPLSNPLLDGTDGKLGRKIAGVSDDDMKFLKGHVSAYEQTLGTRHRLAGELKGDLKLFKVAGEGRIDGTARISRRVELPTDQKDGSVTYSMEGGTRVSAKEKANKGFKLNGLPIDPKFENRLDLAQGATKISMTFTLPKGGNDPTRSTGGRVVPELDATPGSAGMPLQSVSVKSTVEYRDQPFGDPSRGDSKRLSAAFTLDKPQNVEGAVGKFLDGDFRQAAIDTGARVDLKAEQIKRSGTDTQTGLKVDLGVGDVEASLIATTGVNDITHVASKTIQPDTGKVVDTPAPADPKTKTVVPPGPTDDGKTLVVTPYNGAIVRDAPLGAESATLQNGTFVRDRGDRQIDANGQEWTRVAGTDDKDKLAEGWVRSDLLQKHSSATGAMDERGRINPALDHERFDTVQVEKDDNLYDLAQKLGVDPKQMVEVNKDHVINPSLVFQGDKVYLPGTGKGAKPVEVRVEPQQAPTQPGTTGSNDPTKSNGGTSSNGTTSNGQPATPGAPAAPNGSTKATPAAPAAPVNGRPSIDDIRSRYQVGDDTMTDYKPKLGPLPITVPGVDSTSMTSTEASLLDRLGAGNVFDLKEFQKISSRNPDDPGLAGKVADERFPQVDGDGTFVKGGEDGHNDAFRHAYWNGLMSKRFGENFATSFSTAHEGIPGNPADREAMDLYNDEVGRKIARENPDASDEDLAQKTYEAVKKGDMLVVGKDGKLTWSDGVAVGETGYAAPQVLPGTQKVPAYNSN